MGYYIVKKKDCYTMADAVNESIKVLDLQIDQ